MALVAVILLLLVATVSLGALIIRDIIADLNSCPVEPKDPKFKTVKERNQ